MNINSDDFVLCCVQKNEEDYIDEFLQWYDDLGFDKFYIYNNDDNQEKILKCDKVSELKSSDRLYIVNYQGRTNFQIQAYTDFYNTNNFKWALIVDCDEFLDLKGLSIKEYIKQVNEKYGDVNCIGFPWIMYGDNGHLSKTEGKILERFTSYGHGTKSEKNIEIKVMVKGCCGVVYFNTPHSCVFLTNSFNGITSDGNKLENGCFWGKRCDKYPFIRHYWTKSTEEWVYKVMRGLPDGAPMRELDAYFDVNPKTDDRVKAIEKYYKEYMLIHNKK